MNNRREKDFESNTFIHFIVVIQSVFTCVCDQKHDTKVQEEYTENRQITNIEEIRLAI